MPTRGMIGSPQCSTLEGSHSGLLGAVGPSGSRHFSWRRRTLTSMIIADCRFPSAFEPAEDLSQAGTHPVRPAAADALAEQPAEAIQALRQVAPPRLPRPPLRTKLPQASAQPCVSLKVQSPLADGCHLAVGCNGDSQAGARGLERLHQFFKRSRVIELKRGVVYHEIALKYPVAPRNITNGSNRFSS